MNNVRDERTCSVPPAAAERPGAVDQAMVTARSLLKVTAVLILSLGIITNVTNRRSLAQSCCRDFTSDFKPKIKTFITFDNTLIAGCRN